MEKVILGIIRVIQIQNFFQCPQIVYKSLTSSVENGTQIIKYLNYSVEISLLSHLELINCSLSFIALLHCSRWKYQPDENFCHKPPWVFINIFQYFRTEPPWLFPGCTFSNYRFTHIKQPPWLCSHVHKLLLAPTARQIQVLLLLHMIQAVQALDLRTCHLLDVMFMCFLLLMCWRPYIVFITVTPVVILPLLWLAAYSASLQHLEKDMLNVLQALYDKCVHYGLNIGDYTSQEDSHLLDRINHE